MSEKKRTSISIDRDVYEFLKQPEVNQSGLINDLVKQYRDNNDRQVAALRLRYRHLIDEAEEAEERAEKKYDQAEEIKQLLDEAEEAENDGLARAREALSGIDFDEADSDNPAVENWARKLDMTTQQLLTQLRDTT